MSLQKKDQYFIFHFYIKFRCLSNWIQLKKLCKLIKVKPQHHLVAEMDFVLTQLIYCVDVKYILLFFHQK